MFGFRKKKKDDAVATTPQPGEGGAIDAAATSLIERLLHAGFEGWKNFDSAQSIAQEALRAHHGDHAKAIDAIVAQHRKLAATNGFLTGLGGLFTLPVALPANVVGFYLLATRMCAAIAVVRGYDVDRRALRSAVLLTLIGTEADDVLSKAGVATTGRLSSLATKRLPPAVLMVINKAVGFRLIGQLGTKVLARAGKLVPVVGGVVGAGLDVLLLNRIAKNAQDQFPPNGPVAVTAHP